MVVCEKSRLFQAIPGPSPLAMHLYGVVGHQLLELVFQRISAGTCKLCHLARCIKGCRCFEYHTDLIAIGIKGHHVVMSGFVISSMAVIFLAIPGQVSMELFYGVLGDGNAIPNSENRFNYIGVACNLLLIAATETRDIKIGE